MNMVFTMGFRVQIFGRRCALEPAFFFIKRQYTEQLTDKQGEQFWAVSTCQKHHLINLISDIINCELIPKTMTSISIILSLKIGILVPAE